MAGNRSAEVIKLPDPHYDSKTSIEKSLLERRSVRDYTKESLTLSEVSQLLWAAQGITRPGGYRPAPSAGALYPLEIYIIAAKVKDLVPGTYKYRPRNQELVRTNDGDNRAALCRAALGQSPVNDAPVVLVFCAVYERTTSKYGQRGIRYVHMEAGHAAQNVCLQAISLGLGTVVIGAFNDKEVQKVMGLDKDEYPLCILPVGK